VAPLEHRGRHPEMEGFVLELGKQISRGNGLSVGRSYFKFTKGQSQGGNHQPGISISPRQFSGIPRCFLEIARIMINSLKRSSKMAGEKNKKKILAVLMESPFYFTIPLRRRLEFLNFCSQQSVFHQILVHNKQILLNGTSEQK
jgi:hypothetical protein